MLLVVGAQMSDGRLTALIGMLSLKPRIASDIETIDQLTVPQLYQPVSVNQTNLFPLRGQKVS